MNIYEFPLDKKKNKIYRMAWELAFTQMYNGRDVMLSLFNSYPKQLQPQIDKVAAAIYKQYLGTLTPPPENAE